MKLALSRQQMCHYFCYKKESTVFHMDKIVHLIYPRAGRNPAKALIGIENIYRERRNISSWEEWKILLWSGLHSLGKELGLGASSFSKYGHEKFIYPCRSQARAKSRKV